MLGGCCVLYITCTKIVLSFTMKNASFTRFADKSVTYVSCGIYYVYSLY